MGEVMLSFRERDCGEQRFVAGTRMTRAANMGGHRVANSVVVFGELTAMCARLRLDPIEKQLIELYDFLAGHSSAYPLTVRLSIAAEY